MKIKYALISALLFVFALGQPTYAADMDNKSCMDKSVMMEHRDSFDKMMGKLKLTDDQKSKMQALKDKVSESFKDNKAKLMAVQTEINNLIYSDSMDEKKLDDLLNQRTTMLTGMMKNMSMVRNQMYSILDAKQKEQLKSMRAEWMKKHMQ